jgi:hypothetical protein
MNKKIKNATPFEHDGIKFRSKLEMFTYCEFKKLGIMLDYEARNFELIPSFLFMGKKIRPMTYTPDFMHEKFILECKGFGNDQWPIKEKLFKWFLSRHNISAPFYVVSTQKEVIALIDEIKSSLLEN